MTYRLLHLGVSAACTACAIILLAQAGRTQGVRVWPSAALRVERNLSAPDAAVRRESVRALAHLPQSVANRLVANALQDPEPSVRVAAAELALSLRYEPVTRVVVHWLTESDDQLRRVAARVLGAFTLDETAVNGLSRALSDALPEVRLAAAHALGQDGPRATAPLLLAHLEDSSPSVQVAVIEALARLGDERAVLPLISKLQDSRSAVRRAAARALGHLGSERASGALVMLLADSDEGVRRDAVDALGALRVPDTLSALAATADNDRELEVRVAAARGLAQFREAEAVRVLIDMLLSARVELRDEAARALTDVAEIAPQLIRGCLISPRGQEQADACARTLARVEPTTCAGPIASAWRAHTITPSTALEALGMSRDEGALPLILESLAAPDAETRIAAVRAATQLLAVGKPDGRAVEPVVRALQSKDLPPEEMAPLLELLGRTGAARSESVLAAYLAPEVPTGLRISALTGLSFLAAYSGGKEQVLSVLSDSNPGVRWAAVQLVRNAGPGAWAGPILDRFEHASGQDRHALLLALAGPTSRGFQASIASRIAQTLTTERSSLADALLEALAQMPGGTRFVARLLKSGTVRLRPKLAEALATGESATLLSLLGAAEQLQTRVNAAWSLGHQGTALALAQLSVSARAVEPSLAANSVAAIAQIAARTHKDARASLCGALHSQAAFVQANALVGLRLTNSRCLDHRERELLAYSPSAYVRERAAWLLRSTGAPDAGQDQRSLQRCRSDERSARVAHACATGEIPIAATDNQTAVTLFVTPNGQSTAAPGQPFALVSQAGLVRLGWTDRLGAVLDLRPAEGGGELLVLDDPSE